MKTADVAPKGRSSMSRAMGEDPVRAIVADDSRVFLEAISFSLSRRAGIELVGAAQDVDTAMYLVRRFSPHVAVVDIWMPRPGGIGMTKMIKDAYPEIHVIALTVSRDETDLHGMLRAGASGYVLKDDADGLAQAIAAVVKGQSWLTPEMTTKLISSYLASPSVAMEGLLETRDELTPRERAVLAHVARGETNRDIASGLCIAETTVKTHLKSIFAKLEVQNRSEAAAVAWRMGLAGE